MDAPPQGADEGQPLEAEAAAVSPSDRRMEDAAVAAAVAAVRYDLNAPASRALQVSLSSYGAGTLIKLKRRGSLFEAVAEAGLGQLDEPPPTWDRHAKEFLVDVAMSAAARFIVQHLPSWRPDGGASINTYFMRSAFFELKKKYVPYARNEWARIRTERLTNFTDDLVTLDASSADDVEAEVLERVTVAETLALASAEVRPIIELMNEGISQKQIAVRLGIGVNTVHRRVQAYRRVLRANGWITGDAGR